MVAFNVNEDRAMGSYFGRRRALKSKLDLPFARRESQRLGARRVLGADSNRRVGAKVREAFRRYEILN